ncbi:hypothetical protein GCM10023221_17880 [Luteimicrobium xylanilyticum]|nr:hypothetical protein [Luteimicrobium xylanilyticum]
MAALWSIVGVIVGAVLGSLGQAYLEDRRYERDKADREREERKAAYGALLAATSQYAIALSAVSSALQSEPRGLMMLASSTQKEPSGAFVEAADHLQDTFVQTLDTAGMVSLLGSKEVDKAVNQMLRRSTLPDRGKTSVVLWASSIQVRSSNVISERRNILTAMKADLASADDVKRDRKRNKSSEI